MQYDARGFSLMDVIVGVALLLIFFLSLSSLLRASLAVSELGKAGAAATEIATVQMEHLRGLSYDNLGTVGGIPSGVVSQDTTTVENGISYSTHTFISYVDDPADGIGANDTNHVPEDYKRAMVSVSYTILGQTKTVTLVSNFAPPGMESSNGGGTLAVDVVDASGAPVPGATIQIINALTSPTINLTTFTDAGGQLLLGGAATSSSYQVRVSKLGYSSAQTYASDQTNQNPTPGMLTVVKDQTTTQTFTIDRLATLNLATYAPVATSTFTDAFVDSSKLASMSSTTISGGVLTLVSGETSGSALSNATSSAYLAHWGEVAASITETSGTNAVIHVYDGNGALLPDTVLPGNAAGFTSFPVSLSSVSTTTYPSLAIGADLSGTSESAPSISEWSISYTAGPTPLPNVSFTVTGAKTVGTQTGGTPVYKTILTASTGNDGTQGLALEWDNYALTVAGHDIEDACPFPPYSLAPNATVNASLIIGAPSTNYLDVLVTDSTGAIVPDASVTLSRSGYTETIQTSRCGIAYFGGLYNAIDYSARAAKPGYTTASLSGITVSGASSASISFP